MKHICLEHEVRNKNINVSSNNFHIKYISPKKYKLYLTFNMLK